MKNNVAAVIISYNAGARLKECFESVVNQVELVVIVDNGSEFETQNILKEIDKNAKSHIIWSNVNEGIATALNKGIKYALNENIEWILTMDNDSIATENMVDIMFDAYKNYKGINKKNIVSIAPNFVDIAYKEEKKYLDKIEEKQLVITSGNLVNKKAFEMVGFFEEKYFIDYVDNEFCLRLLEKGLRIIQVNEAKLLHRLGEGTSRKILGKEIKSTNHSPMRRYYLTRNSLDVMSRYNHLNVRHINNTKRVLFKFILEILLVEKNKFKKIKSMYEGYRDFKNKRFGEKC